MKSLGIRALGFSAPTLVVVTTLHLNRDASVGEAIDRRDHPGVGFGRSDEGWDDIAPRS